MDRNLCLNRKNVKLYKILHEAVDNLGDAIYGITLITYHYIENNGLIFTMEKTKFEKEFVRLNMKGD
jgi:hypothetical protein